ncbi:MAG: acyl-CoA dehydrogenase [Gammaproteobacteria bacterium]|nr:acyl-CoA dehydrogenase [Gammaproteobacteria bacterium]
MPYTAPVRDLVFACELADLAGVARLPGFEDATPELLRSVLDEAGKFAAEVLAPLNHSGDRRGARLEGGRVVTADGWRDAYRQFVAGGWNGLPFDPAFGGQGLPWLAATAVAEIWHAANMAFSLCPLLTQSAIAAIEAHGTPRQRDTFLPKLVSGEWSGTMNLTEPQAGSDLSAVRTRAVPATTSADGDHHRISGQKIFITYGDHDLTDNIIHLVLARTPDAPPGVKGISLFIVPKFLPDNRGAWTRRNAIETLSLEHKLGIHASPTAVLGYGGKSGGDGGGDGENGGDDGGEKSENSGAIGYLVGEENRGLMYMFTMMNLARHAVGVEGNGVAERAYQQAAGFAAERVQGRADDNGGGGGERVPIIRHPDVKRMLLAQKCRIEALRALSLTVAANIDHARRQPDAEAKARARDLLEVLTPVIKGYATEVGVENVSLALQVHGGMGFIEETGAAQHYRDQRITPIYEGTTGIQAMDLVGRKLTADGGAATARVIARIRAECEALGDADDQDITVMADAMRAALDLLQAAAESLVAAAAADARLPGAVAEPYLRLWGVTACGWRMLKAAAVSRAELARDGGDGGDGGDAFYRHKIHTAKFYFAAEMPQASALAEVIGRAAPLIADAGADLFEVA